jgi:hypothetical protein
MTRARFDEIKQHAGQEYAGGLRTETIAAFKDLIAEVEARGKFDDDAPAAPEPEPEPEREDVRRTSGARKK